MIRVFTSAAPNYLGKVRALVASLQRHHPELALHLILADRPPFPTTAAEEGVESILSLSDLGFEDPGWLFSHSTVELCTAVKGRALELLLAIPDTEAVLYLDPDIVLFSRLDDLVESLRQSSLALTPHLLQPESELDAVLDNEVCALRHGVFNLGFLGVSNTAEGRRFAAWWRERLDALCRAEPESGLFTDQKWMDFAPCFFPGLAILRAPRFNVAPWNLSQRRVSGSFDRGFTVDGQPLGFYHFTGFDSGAHEAMLGKYAPGNRALSMLAEWYRRRTLWLAPREEIDWRLGRFSDGAPIQPLHRLVYRRRPDLGRAFPDPFRAGDRDTYRFWFEHQAPLEYPELRDTSTQLLAEALERERQLARLLGEERERAAALALDRERAVARADAERGEADRALARQRALFERSTSWRLTAPLRLAGRLLERLGWKGQR